MTGDFHPTDSYSLSAARTTDSTKLTLNFEDAVRLGQGDVEIVAAVAIAKVAQLELMLEMRSEMPDNVVLLRKEAPTRFGPLGA